MPFSVVLKEGEGEFWGNWTDSSVGLGGKHTWYQEWRGRGKFDQTRMEFQFRLSWKFFMLYDGLSVGLVLSVELDNLQATSKMSQVNILKLLILFFFYPVLPDVWIHLNSILRSGSQPKNYKPKMCGVVHNLEFKCMSYSFFCCVLVLIGNSKSQ